MTAADTLTHRRIVHRTRGGKHGPITRLMSPSDLGYVVKPFVFLDLFEAEGGLTDMPVHPHSGIGTITVFTKGDVRFDDPDSGTGTITYSYRWLRCAPRGSSCVGAGHERTTWSGTPTSGLPCACR